MSQAKTAFDAINNDIFAQLIEQYTASGQATVVDTRDTDGAEIRVLTFSDGSALDFFDGYASVARS